MFIIYTNLDELSQASEKGFVLETKHNVDLLVPRRLSFRPHQNPGDKVQVSISSKADKQLMETSTNGITLFAD